MSQSFEQTKNIKASAYTATVCGTVLAVLLLLSWSVPTIEAPPTDEGVEVNLGFSDEGSGNIAPQVPGEPAPEAADNNNLAVNTSAASNSNPSETADPTDAEPSPTATATTPTTQPTTTNTVKNTNPSTANTPTPTPPKPKAQMGKYSGGNGQGGNNADSYNGVSNQGIAGGNGDQGKPNGNPNSNNYDGNGGTGGVTIRSGLNGRRFTKNVRFEDEFNENAKVAVDITVNATGTITKAVINPKGTTTANNNIKNIAIKRAYQLKMNAADDEGFGTIVFEFKLQQ
ncbi:MAG TPA: hypothetical protein DCQ29_14010 [Chitinophagaceae bacterium]|nr:hypothetical protein [Chitinophagaceae bacterium]